LDKNKLLISLLIVMFLVFVAITVFELAKYMIFPGLTVFYSHMIGIAFGVMIVGVTAYRVQKKQEKLLIEKIDETERRMHSEASFRNVEENYRKLFFDSMDGVCKTTLDGKIVEANQAFCDILGCDADKIIGESIVPFYDNPEERIKFRNAIENNKGVKNFEIIQKRMDGTRITCSISSSYFYSQEGKLEGYLTILRDITERKRAEEALKESEKRYRELSIIDDLTQLYNSRHFYFHLKNELERANRYEQPLTLLLLDLDNFKHFNDTYGHVEGDQVLWRLGQVVKRCLRETDFAYRYGGEEFTILLPMTTSTEGFVTAERIRTEFKKEIFPLAPVQDVHVTVSIGLAQYKPPEEMKVFVHRVDQLMYQGKKNGKDRVCCETSPQEQFKTQSSLPF
jgi:diguanylate cyclase (GGDEF)-like protein/PAS domain S-box-containing protein